MIAQNFSLILTFFMSCAGVMLTLGWYNFTEVKFSSSRSKPIAYLKATKNEIQRRYKSRILWEEVDKGTPLFDGDAVRTGEDAEGTVHIIDSGTDLSLESDSVIVVENKAKKLELNLLSGSVFLKDTGGGKKGAVLKSGNLKLDISKKNTELSLSKTAEGPANLQVSKGEIGVAVGGKKFSLTEGKAATLSKSGLTEVKTIQPVAPKQYQTIISADLSKPISYRWKGVPSDYRVFLTLGTNRKKMKRVGLAADGAKDQLLGKVLKGKYYWQFVAERNGNPKEKIFGPLMRAEGVFAFPPVPVSPILNEQIVAKNRSLKVNFEWKVPKGSKEVFFEIADNPQLRGAKAIKLARLESTITRTFEKTGSFYWRVKTTWPSGIKSQSKIQKFTMLEKQQIVPPVLVTPEEAYKITTTQLKYDPLFFEWDTNANVKSYELEISKKDKVLTTKKNLAPFSIVPIKKTGKYSWRVRSQDEEGDWSKWSLPSSFVVVRAKPIAWVMESMKIHKYETQNPSVNLNWKGGGRLSKWKVKWSSDKKFASYKEQIVDSVGVVIKHLENGRYFYRVSQLDSNSKVVAESKVLSLKISPVGPLKAPVMNKDKIKANGSGTARIEWKGIKGAQEYEVEYTHDKTGNAKIKSFSNPRAILRRLLPGSYTFKIRTINKRGQPGEFGTPKVIEVPKKSDIRAPSMDGVKFK